ncbi:MAG: transporter [Cellulosilyticaceae bacterium]
MKKIILMLQIATIFVGSIVGAGLSSGRELNQFFSVYGWKSFVGLIVCGLAYVIVGKMIVNISIKSKVTSYNEFVSLVCPKGIAFFTNIVLTLFLLSSTSIILAGSCAVINQYFGVPRWVGFIIMIVCSIMFLLRNTEGLFEVNTIVVPALVCVMTCIFLGFVQRNTETMSIQYIASIVPRKRNWLGSSMIYAGFNIISVIGVIVPLSTELKKPKVIMGGVIIGTIILTIISGYITFLMMVNPNYPRTYEIPILAVATQINRIIEIGLLMVIWLEMFSSQISNVYSLSRALQSQFEVPYNTGIFLILAVAAPFSLIGFSKLVDVLYPLYGVLSMAFIISCVAYYFRMKHPSYSCSAVRKNRL